MQRPAIITRMTVNESISHGEKAVPSTILNSHISSGIRITTTMTKAVDTRQAWMAEFDNFDLGEERINAFVVLCLNVKL